jgi:electron transport complex protein RnfB
MSLIQRIDALLPQTQCGKCGHPGCKPYAEGIASGEPINKCPPGGSETIAALAELLLVPVLELDTSRGRHRRRSPISARPNASVAPNASRPAR